MSFHLITSRDDGAGTAFLANHAAERILEDAEVESESVIRVHVPGRGEGGSGDGTMRGALDPMVPALQSVSLFGDLQAVMLLGAQQLTAAEGDALAELVSGADPEAVLLVVVAAGRPPARFVKALKAAGAEEQSIKAVRERDAAEWLGTESRRRRIQIGGDGRQALLAAFGTDLASISGALDQLEASGGPFDAVAIANRFRNRPDEPMWHYMDAVFEGNTDLALRRLEDFLTHGHPLQILAGLESDARRRAVAVEEADSQSYADRIGAKSDWKSRRDFDRASALGRERIEAELAAIAKAERILKSAPEPLHQVTMERLTVALSRRARRR